jgi:3-oxoacyl-[acyl-carrier-protein] synthase II
METALLDAGLSSADIGMVVSHGMGDPAIDAQERQALGDVLPDVPLVAPIASLGHTGAASGTMAMIVGAMSLAGRVIPPTLNASLSDACFRSEPEDLHTDHVLCLSHTAEGNAMAVVLARADR